MKIKNIPHVIILLLLIKGCGSPMNKKKQESQNEATETFEAVDVYGNPNTFEQRLGRLLPGDLPPPMKIERWFNGTAIQTFEEGKVYVVEFFASWCQPCRKSIPHLNKLQKEFSDELVIIGLAASEAEPNTRKLEKLINSKKDGLTYRVAYTSDEKTFKDWNWGARNTGLPWAFIIDKKGKIAWFGQPFYSRFEPVLRSVLNDTYSYTSDSLIDERNYQSRKVLWDVQESFWNAVGEKDWPASLAFGHQLYESGDQLFYYEMAQLFQIKYQETGEKEKSIAYAKELVSGLLKGIPEGMAFIAEVIEEDENAVTKNLTLALEIANECNRLTLNESPELLYLEGRLYDRLARTTEANQAFLKALEYNSDEALEVKLRERLRKNSY